MTLFPQNSTSLTKKYCTQPVYDSLKNSTTASGFTLDMAIRSGLINEDSTVGIYAGDAECYETFSPVFIPIIEEYHGTGRTYVQPHSFERITAREEKQQFPSILSSRIRAARNISGFSFTPHITRDDRRKLEETVRSALSKLRGDLAGDYISFSQLSEAERKELDSKKLLFAKGDRFQDAAGINRDFPQNRGIYLSKDKRIRIWVNEEDHLRIICQDSSSNLAAVFNLFCNIHSALEQSLPFCHSQKYGFLTSCPTNIGTSMRAGVHMRLTKLNSNRELLEDIVAKHGLQIRGTGGEKTAVEDGVFDISNKRRFGLSEVEIIASLQKGVKALLAEDST